MGQGLQRETEREVEAVRSASRQRLLPDRPFTAHDADAGADQPLAVYDRTIDIDGQVIRLRLACSGEAPRWRVVAIDSGDEAWKPAAGDPDDFATAQEAADFAEKRALDHVRTFRGTIAYSAVDGRIRRYWYRAGHDGPTRTPDGGLQFLWSAEVDGLAVQAAPGPAVIPDTDEPFFRAARRFIHQALAQHVQEQAGALAAQRLRG